MSWLFVAVIPGLLMLATFGLQRVESRLNRDCVGATDVAEFFAQARPADMCALARDGLPVAWDGMQRRRAAAVDEPVPTAANPQFRPTRRADSV